MTNEEIVEIYENMRKDYEFTKEIDFTEVNKVFGLAKKAVKYRKALEKTHSICLNWHTGLDTGSETIEEIAREALKV